MLDEEIKRIEETGANVAVVSESGIISYQTKKVDDNIYCDNCGSLRLLPDPDPYDWFCDSDMKAVCLEMEAVIASALGSSEWTEIPKPLYCPNLGRDLTNEEKEEAQKRLVYGKNRMYR